MDVKSGTGLKREINKDTSKKYVKPYKAKIDDSKTRKNFINLYDKIQTKNIKIMALETELMEVLDQKNTLMGDLDQEIMKHDNLDYEHRVILRAISCLGEKCSDDLSHLVNMDEKLIAKYIDELTDLNWVEEVE